MIEGINVAPVTWVGRPLRILGCACALAVIGPGVARAFGTSSPQRALHGPVPVLVPGPALSAGDAIGAAALPLTGSAGNVVASVGVGTLTLTTPYNDEHRFDAGKLSVNQAGTALVTTAAFPSASDAPITITDTREPAESWTGTVSLSAPTAESGSTISSSAPIGLTSWIVTVPPGNGFPPTQVRTLDLPAGGSGIIRPGFAPATFATSPAGDGTAQLRALLTVSVPPTTRAGTYVAEITFTVA